MNLIKKYWMYILVLLIILIGLIFWALKPKNEEVIEEYDEPVIREEQEEEKKVETFKIDIKGEVIKPGVYEVNSEMIVDDAIKLAGGLTDKADTSDINLSQVLVKEMVIIINSKETVKKETGSKVTVGAITSNQNSSTGKVSLNNASLAELMTLSGIGEAKAKLIIAYRETKPFTTIEEITNVKGIGEATFEKNKDRLTL